MSGPATQIRAREQQQQGNSAAAKIQAAVLGKTVKIVVGTHNNEIEYQGRITLFSERGLIVEKIDLKTVLISMPAVFAIEEVGPGLTVGTA